MNRSTPVRRLKNGVAGCITSDTNPLSHSASVAFLLLTVLAVTGAVLFLFYPATFPENYETIVRFEKENFLAALMRGVHRHTADLVALFVLIHFARVTFGDRGRAKKLIGARMAGGALLLFFMAQAITGSILPMNEKSGAIIMVATQKLPLPDVISSAFAISDKIPGSAIVYLLALHLIPPFIAIGLLYFHLAKIKKPRLFPKPVLLAGLTVGIIIAALYAPKPLAIADFSTIPGKTPFDWLLLFPLALLATIEPALFWPLSIGALLLFFLVLVSPSLKGAEQTVTFAGDKCVGCSLCQVDCPYTAITMEVTPPDRKHPLIAIIDKESCTGCAVCIGSCSFDALSMPGNDGKRVKSDIEKFFEKDKDKSKMLTLACKNRHDVEFLKKVFADSGALIAPLQCTGELLAESIEEAYKAGSESVIVALCPESECRGRYGSVYAEERLSHKRKPWLRKKNAKGPILLYEGNTKGLIKVIGRQQHENLMGSDEVTSKTFQTVKSFWQGRRCWLLSL